MQIFKKKRPLFDEINNLNIIKISVVLVLFVVFFLTVGYSAFNTSFDIGSLTSYVTIDKDIRITKFSLNGSSNGGVSNWNQHTKTTTSTNIDLPNADSTVSFDIDVTNLGNVEMGLLRIDGMPPGLKYEITGYELKDMLCDSVDSTKCKLGSKTKFVITFSRDDVAYPPVSTNFDVDLSYLFKRFYNVTYINLNPENLPSKVLENDDLNITFSTPYPGDIQVNDNNNYTYNASTGNLIVSNIESDIEVVNNVRTYFVNYDGNNTLFNQFDKTNITKFARNTELSEEQVLAKYNNNEAFIISTSADDPDYPSSHEVYAWVENNELYWWSSAYNVYYHPSTRNAFRNMTNLLYVDVNGTDSSLVRNLSHWFDKDAKLKTINGKINTRGLVLESSSFNFTNDTAENNSSEVGLAFMFNDCKVLTSIDLSEFDTKNATDMKRMFGGCANLTSIDVSHFDTSNARSMYWMFRKTEKLTNVDLRSFDTSNVENMVGMFTASGVKELKLGEDFNTSKVKNFNNMFSSAQKLETIYAYSDFQTNSYGSSNSMFSNASKLVGSRGTDDAFAYDRTKININYAKLAANGVSGYLTPYDVIPKYYITYELNGGTSNNPTFYYDGDGPIELSDPVKDGYTFIGWTGSNGNNIQRHVTIPAGTTGNLHYEAHYNNNDAFPLVFSVPGPCHFGGSATNITGDNCVSELADGTDFTNGNYIDTGVQLYTTDTIGQDFEVYFELSDYDPSQQETGPDGNKQNTIFNSKIEIDALLNPGVVLRKAEDQLELKSNAVIARFPYLDVNAVRIVRKDYKMYYSINGSDLLYLNDVTDMDSTFNLNVWFGASQKADGQPFRYANCTLSNIYIRLGTSS